MLYTYGKLDGEERQVVEDIDAARHQLRHYVRQNPKRWTGLLARMTRARALRASNSIEGIDVSGEDALAAVDNEEPAEAAKGTWRAVTGYHTAMNYVLQRCGDDDFQFSRDVLLAIHFMISQHDPDANPGKFRPGWVGVHNAESGDLVHEGADRDRLEPLVGELMAYMNDDGGQPVVLKAAMAHLNLALMHPFSDGNGRTARCLQTAVFANEGIMAPVFSSIEEYAGRNQREYYDVLARVGGGGWNPERDSKDWVRFCLTAHYRQARTLLRRTRETERVYGELKRLAERRGLPERTALALLEAAFGLRVRNASYRVSAGISNNLASRDLKALVDLGLLIPKGERRGRRYAPSDRVKAIRAEHRTGKGIADPFERGPVNP